MTLADSQAMLWQDPLKIGAAMKVNVSAVGVLALGLAFCAGTSQTSLAGSAPPGKPRVLGVKYLLERSEAFDESLPRIGIAEKVAIKGRFIEFKEQPVCKISPCDAVRQYALEDVKDKSYRIPIDETNALRRRLKAGRVYQILGILRKQVDFGNRSVTIAAFEPERLLSPDQ